MSAREPCRDQTMDSLELPLCLPPPTCLSSWAAALMGAQDIPSNALIESGAPSPVSTGTEARADQHLGLASLGVFYGSGCVGHAQFSMTFLFVRKVEGLDWGTGVELTPAMVCGVLSSTPANAAQHFGERRKVQWEGVPALKALR